MFTDTCPTCFSTDLRTRTSEGQIVCMGCGYLMDEHATAMTSYVESYTGPHTRILSGVQELPRPHARFTHKRYHHFKSWLQRIQGKERVHLLRDDRDRIVRELEKYHMHEETEYHEMRFVLKRLRLQKYYNNIFYLMNQIHGEPMIELAKEHERILLKTFLDLQTPFSRSRGQRVNMLSYTYIIRKVGEYHGWHDLAAAMPRMVSMHKIYLQDQIWRTVCEEIGIPFTNSLL